MSRCKLIQGRGVDGRPFGDRKKHFQVLDMTEPTVFPSNPTASQNPISWMKSGPWENNVTESHQWKGHVNQEKGGKGEEGKSKEVWRKDGKGLKKKRGEI